MKLPAASCGECARSWIQRLLQPMNKKVIILLLVFVLLSGAMYLLVQYGFETFISDVATRLAYQVRDDEPPSLRWK